ncbi:serine O-acetyltransferase [Pedobacter sp. JCM 36344]|uniref:serine O-acetyltransferase n=1 Tax=Pedobacter sp. JCM 36344 TaxID=3374280 RepID=UPI0039797D73
MLNLLKRDLKRYSKVFKPFPIIRTILFEHSFHLVFFFRLGFFFRTIPIIGSFLGIITEYFIRIFFASDISCRAKIGGGLFIVHGHDIVIGSKVKIGENCKIFNGVTLGGKYTEIEDAPQPSVGNNIILSTGAKILGDIFIGDNSVVGANSVVLTSVEPNSVVVGIPARYVKKDVQ